MTDPNVPGGPPRVPHPDDLAVRAEQALLGAVLLDPVGQQPVLDLVEPGDMRRPWHGQVLSAMRRVLSASLAPGPAEVYRELQHDPDLPGSVSRDAVPLADLMEFVPRAEHAGVYAVMVVEGGVRRRLGLSGSRLSQAAMAGDLEAALHQAGFARGEVAACAARWLALPAELRAGPVSACGERRGRVELVRDAAAVREEIGRLRSEVAAGRTGAVGEKAAMIARRLAQTAAAADLDGEHRPGEAARPLGEVAETAGARALRDLAAGPAGLAEVSGWLEPAHFAAAGDGEVFAVMRDLHAAGRPVDAVTVSWEAARRGLQVEPESLAGGTGAFAVASAREVHRHGLLARAEQVGRNIQDDAADLTCPPPQMIVGSDERLRVLQAAPQPERDHSRRARVVAQHAPAQGEAQRELGREAVR